MMFDPWRMRDERKQSSPNRETDQSQMCRCCSIDASHASPRICRRRRRNGADANIRRRCAQRIDRVAHVLFGKQCGHINVGSSGCVNFHRVGFRFELPKGDHVRIGPHKNIQRLRLNRNALTLIRGAFGVRLEVLKARLVPKVGMPSSSADGSPRSDLATFLGLPGRAFRVFAQPKR